VEQVIPSHFLGGEVEASNAGEKAGVGHVIADLRLRIKNPRPPSGGQSLITLSLKNSPTIKPQGWAFSWV
jgi:hypothetical protein